MTGVDRRAVSGGKIRGVEDVLDADGKPAQWRARELRPFGIATCSLDVERGERADLGLARGDRLGAKLGYGARGEVAGVDPASATDSISADRQSK